MLSKMGSNFGGGLDISDAPKITFDGSWLPWHIEFYTGQAYWEAWCFTSGTLTLAQHYTVDAWGIGGGGAQERSDSDEGRASAGSTNMVLGAVLPSGGVAVTIGAGGDADNGNGVGGATQLGSVLTCNGGSSGFNGDSAPATRNRFNDLSRNEHGRGGDAGNGWLDFTPSTNEGVPSGGGPGHGIGAGAKTSNVWGARGTSGALVIRIKMD